MRRRLWLATASLLYVAWRRMRAVTRRGADDAGMNGSGIAA